MRKWLLLLGIGCLASSRLVLAAGEPTYQLTCLPNDGDLFQEQIAKMRLALHGWHEAAVKPDYQLCIRLAHRQQIYYQAAPFDLYHPYDRPAMRIVDIPYLTMSVTRQDGVTRELHQDLASDRDKVQRFDDGLRRLLDRLPLM